MRDTKAVITSYGEFSKWLISLKELSNEEWIKPIAEGKWSVREMISHFMNWDNYIIATVVPLVKDGEPFGFPEFESFNKLASSYATSGISKDDLLDEVILTRNHLVQVLKDMPEEVITKSLPVGGHTHCPHTGEPYSLIYIIQEFIEHDLHHKRQLQGVLK
ncbi:DinB family protein [Bacillus luteolus]|uniref:DinB family protein n=1 Tax=Litchfieldia luteola TaxID=682179 RepID=A0ABR9QH39_9BACI|nr:DinB family protein [Cytobacillus luteolus]MBE4907805.1 DinB family protein [Cytobacillus luteolus]MBP1944038.1 putative damage-inducible protein DinB [Cytobacillus luteolus]